MNIGTLQTQSAVEGTSAARLSGDRGSTTGSINPPLERAAGLNLCEDKASLAVDEATPAATKAFVAVRIRAVGDTGHSG